MAKKPPTFEESMIELEQIVDRMEQGGLPLDESLRLFERGIQLTRLCQTSLKEAEQKVSILMEQNGELKLRPFNHDNP